MTLSATWKSKAVSCYGRAAAIVFMSTAKPISIHIAQHEENNDILAKKICRDLEVSEPN